MSTDKAAAGRAAGDPTRGEPGAQKLAAKQGFEFSAGGVVVRDGQVAVIVPTRRGAGGVRVLGLPKGHPESGESSWEGAAREVREEAGLVGEPLGSLGIAEYIYHRGGKTRRKRVEFFLIEYRTGSLEDHDHEVEEAYWLPIADAARELTYAGEREMVNLAAKRLGLEL